MTYPYAIRRLLGTALLAGLGTAAFAQAQNMGIGTTAPNPKAALEIASSNKGLLIPRLDSVQRTGISSPPQGLIVYQTDGRAGIWYYQGSWQFLKAGNQTDNLGNHTATQALNLGANRLVGGGTTGISVSNGGGVTVDNGLNVPAGGATVIGTTTLMGNSNVNTIGSAATNIGTSTTAGTVTIGRTGGTVRLGNLAGPGPRVVTVDGGGNLSTTAFPAQESTTASNGLTLTGTNVRLGGPLSAATTVAQGGNPLAFTGGNVGVGTPTPGARLHVDGDALVQGSGPGLSTAQIAQLISSNTLSSATAVGQSFTLAAPSTITSIAFQTDVAGGSETLTLYDGSNTVVYSQAVTVTAGINTVVLTTPLALPAGTYRFQVTITPAFDYRLAASGTNPYSGGTFYLGGSPFLAYDAYFVITYQTVVTTAYTPLYASGSTGRIGIGTSAPAATLHVAGSTSTVQLEGLAGTGARVVTVDASGNLSAGPTPTGQGDDLGNHTATQNLNLGANLLTGGGASGLSLTSAGFVGIGVPVPATRLHVSGTARLDGGANVLQLVGSGVGSHAFASFYPDGFAAGRKAYFGFPSDGSTDLRLFNERSGGTIGLSAAGAGAVTLATNGTTRLTVDGTGNTLVGGSLGIGTTAPTGLLQVVGHTLASQVVDQSQTTNNFTISLSDIWQSFQAGITGQMTQLDFFSGSPFFSTPSSVTITVYSGTGTGGPVLGSASLPVSGFLAWRTFVFATPFAITAGQPYTFRVQSQGFNNAWVNMTTVPSSYPNGQAGVYAGADLPFRTYVQAALTNLTLTAESNGNVGIGTSSPSQKLDVTGNANVTGNSYVSGNVGIGTTSPSASLDVNGGLVIRDNGAFVITTDNFAITVGNRSYLRLGSNNTTSTNRSITLSNGVQVGQMLIISNASSASFGVTNGAFNIGDTGNVNLAANPRTFGVRDNLTLLWDGEQWIEISFTNN